MAEEGYFLIGSIILAVAVRSIDPIQHMALGQSDAYSHLQFLRNVMDTGFVHNVMYPPGYHWILSLPTAAFHLDPYLVARYGGAFFGAGLVLAVYVFVKSVASQPAPIFSAFFVSCFPGLYLLQKTGVGAFANQLGLFFIPVVFYFYIMTEEQKFSGITDGLYLAVTIPYGLVRFRPDDADTCFVDHVYCPDVGIHQQSQEMVIPNRSFGMSRHAGNPLVKFAFDSCRTGSPAKNVRIDNRGNLNEFRFAIISGANGHGFLSFRRSYRVSEITIKPSCNKSRC